MPSSHNGRTQDVFVRSTQEGTRMAYVTCGARTKNGELCQNIAGKGTDHVGEGKCRSHGGSTPIKHGIYSKVRGTLGKRIHEIKNDPNIYELTSELALLKALNEQATVKYQE